MAFDPRLAERIRRLIAESIDAPHTTERKMFGGLAFLVQGNLAIAASSAGGILARVDPSETAALMRRSHAEPAEMAGRIMSGWLRVDADHVRTARQLQPWVERSCAFARSLPPKG